MELAKEKRGHFLYRLFCPKGIFFNVRVLSQCIEYWINFQDIHIFTYQKTLLNTLFLLVFKICCFKKLVCWWVYQICMVFSTTKAKDIPHLLVKVYSWIHELSIISFSFVSTLPPWTRLNSIEFLKLPTSRQLPGNPVAISWKIRFATMTLVLYSNVSYLNNRISFIRGAAILICVPSIVPSTCSI